MSVSTEISRLQGLRNDIRTKLIALEVLENAAADLEDCKTAIEDIVNNGAVSKTLDSTTTSYVVPAGYHNGAGTVSVTLEAKNVTPTSAVQEITPTTGKLLNKVTVAAAPTETKSITANGTYTPSSGKVGFSQVVVNVENAPVLQAKTVTPTTSQQTVSPDEGYDGLSGVTVNAIPSNYADVSGVTAAAGDVLANKIIITADGTEAAGTMPNNGAVTATIDGLTETSYTIPKGYHSGSGTVALTNDIETALAAI